MPRQFDTVSVKYNNLNLLLKGFATKGSPMTRDYPGDDDEFEIHYVYLDEHDITDLLSDDQINDLETLALGL